MPFPQDEVLRQTVEQAIHRALRGRAYSYQEQLPDGQEIEFRVRDDGKIWLTICLSEEEIAKAGPDDPVEREWDFVVEVRHVPHMEDENATQG
jgi:hypothetical protein